MELHHLRCVVAIVDHGTFSAAAAAMHLSQPSLSYAVARLERELGARLFDRSSSGTRLTAAGEAFIDPARRALGEANIAHAAVQAVSGVVGGRLRVSCIRTAVVETASNVAAFQRRHRDVRLVVDEPGSDTDVVDAVRSGRSDIGIMRTLAVPSDLVATALGAQEFVVIFPTALAPRRTTVTLASLNGVPLIAPLAGTPIRRLHDLMLRDAGVEPSIVTECAHLEIVIELVRSGVGAAMTTGSRAAGLAGEQLQVRRLRPAITTDLCAATRATGASPATVAFLARLQVAPLH